MPVWLLAGGKSKGADFAPLAAEIAHRARGTALFGSASGELGDRIHGQSPHFPCVAVETMDERSHGAGPVLGRPTPSCCRRLVRAPTSSAIIVSGASISRNLCHLANPLNR